MSSRFTRPVRLAIILGALLLFAVGATALAQKPGSDTAPQDQDKSVQQMSKSSNNDDDDDDDDDDDNGQRIRRIVPSDRVDFDIFAPGGSYWAEVIGGPTPSFRYSSGHWTNVSRVGPGHYCLNGAGFNYPAVVSVSNRLPRTVPTPPGALVQYDSFGADCPGVGVFTYEAAP